ncbi:MAG: nitrilase family protein [Cyclobacteriaceae bacterium]|jgi:predicted amidohydrolase|nr:nitrilase family protein [Cyclobacteriaceae bacterium]
MQNIIVASVQFECHNGVKDYNLQVIDRIAGEASRQGVQVISFHECSVSGYTFARKLTKEQLVEVAEFIPHGKSTQELIGIAARHNITLLAGLFEKDLQDNVYNSYVCVNGNGVIAKHRKLHTFISPYLTPGNSYTTFELHGWKCGILICYDNNIVENVRATALLGAQIIFMPHVTMCTPSSRPGAGFVDPQLWINRELNPEALRAEFDGLKGREWLMRWLPARAYDNGVYVVFSNPIGMDEDQLKNGCSMILDPFGGILVECRKLGDDWVKATLTPDALTKAGGNRYIKARRPDLYRNIIGQEHRTELKVSWLNTQE